MIFWSKDSKKFACIREDERKVGDLWVIDSLAEPRPVLQTYKYGMPGEENQPQPEILISSWPAKAGLKLRLRSSKILPIIFLLRPVKWRLKTLISHCLHSGWQILQINFILADKPGIFMVMKSAWLIQPPVR